MKRSTKRLLFVLIHPITILIIVLLGWEASAAFNSKVVFLASSPSLIFESFVQLLLNEKLHFHFFLTGAEALTGLLIGTLIGTSTGLLLWYAGRSANAARIAISAFSSFPVFALAPLMIIWFGVGFSMKVAMATLATAFVALSQAYNGATTISKEYVQLLEGMGATRWQVLFKLILPGSITSVLGGMRINVGLSLLGAFIGEFIASEAGLGHLILRASGLYDTSRAFAGAICIVILAMIFDFAAQRLEHHRHFLVQFISVPRPLWTRLSGRNTKA